MARKSIAAKQPAGSNTPIDRQADDPIRCTMTDRQYHELYNQLAAIEGVLTLVRLSAEDADDEILIGLQIMEEKTKAAKELMGAAWSRTMEAHHG